MMCIDHSLSFSLIHWRWIEGKGEGIERKMRAMMRERQRNRETGATDIFRAGADALEGKLSLFPAHNPLWDQVLQEHCHNFGGFVPTHFNSQVRITVVITMQSPPRSKTTTGDGCDDIRRNDREHGDLLHPRTGCAHAGRFGGRCVHIKDRYFMVTCSYGYAPSVKTDSIQTIHSKPCEEAYNVNTKVDQWTTQCSKKSTRNNQTPTVIIYPSVRRASTSPTVRERLKHTGVIIT